MLHNSGGGPWSAAQFIELPLKMKVRLVLILYLIVASTLVIACVSPPQQPSALDPTPTIDSAQDAMLQSDGGGEPRSLDYWLIWNTCAEGNKSETARANGGREARWILMDDLLTDPGVLIGTLQIETCQQGVNLLQARNLQDIDMKNDAAYILAAQLLAAQLNLATGSEYCLASAQAVSQAQLLLLELNFNGTNSYLGPPVASSKIEDAQKLTEQLVRYNTGHLCIP